MIKALKGKLLSQEDTEEITPILRNGDLGETIRTFIKNVKNEDMPVNTVSELIEKLKDPLQHSQKNSGKNSF